MKSISKVDRLLQTLWGNSTRQEQVDRVRFAENHLRVEPDHGGQKGRFGGVFSLGLLAHLRFEGGWGRCQGGLTTEPEDIVGALGFKNNSVS